MRFIAVVFVSLWMILSACAPGSEPGRESYAYSTESPSTREYKFLGANLAANGERNGASFRIWLPNAQKVELLVDRFGWEAAPQPLERQWDTGVWSAFVEGVQAGDRYKYRILDARGQVQYRIDPYARYIVRDNDVWNAMVVNPAGYRWESGEFSLPRHQVRLLEVHPGTLIPGRPNASFREIADYLVPLARRSNYNAISFMPVNHHNVMESWGYQPGGYYSTNFRHGTPDDFKYLVDTLHKHGIGVIIDLVHSHASKDWDTGLGGLDGTQLYFHEGIMGDHPQWGTYLFNYARWEVRDFLLSNAIFWLDEYRVDGFRIDGVASMLYLDYARNSGEWTPAADGSNNNYAAAAYLRELNRQVHQFRPGVLTIAEESSGYPGVTSTDGLGFDFAWRMGGMHHIRQFLSMDPLFRDLSYILQPVSWNERYVNYVDSHDETAHGKRFYIDMISERDDFARFAQARNVEALINLVYPGLVMNFQGNEFGNRGWWDERTSPNPGLVSGGNLHDRFAHYMSALGDLYLHEEVLQNTDPSSSRTLALDNDRDVIVQARFDRKGEGRLVVVQNFGLWPHGNLAIPVPHGGRWMVVFNSDAAEFGGEGSAPALGKAVAGADGAWTVSLDHLPRYATVVLKSL